MIYKNFKDIKISSLGMGCMRLPILDNDITKIDMELVKKMVKYSMDKGINYYDTAWGYHSGNSEIAMGEILKDYPRSSYFLTSKFPGYDKNNCINKEEIFNTQLNKCQTSYFDFYLFHSVSEANIDNYLDPKYDLLNFLLKKKEEGKIRYLGFSTHGSIETTKRFLDNYAKHLDFCQIQLNYIDYKLQNAKGMVELLKQYNLPIWVMEPLRGGKLVNLDNEYSSDIKNIRDISNVEMAFRFLQTFPEVTVILSGMSNFEQIKDNIDIFNEFKPLNDNEFISLLKIGDKILSKKTLPCTACRYCVDYCPMNLNIPKIIDAYNEDTYSNGSFLTKVHLNALGEGGIPSKCIGCRACENVCPQNIKISEMMSLFKERLEK